MQRPRTTKNATAPNKPEHLEDVLRGKFVQCSIFFHDVVPCIKSIFFRSNRSKISDTKTLVHIKMSFFDFFDFEQ